MMPDPTDAWGICGHRSAVEQLQRSIIQQRIIHALLLAGPRSLGKTTLATSYAKAICCLNPPAPALFCGSCRACRKIGRGVYPDMQLFDLAAQAAISEKSGGKNTGITIETVREVSSTSALRPIEGRWRIVLLDDAETLNEVAQEALLKTLEEPPPSMLLILLADDLEALLPTIRSRCQLIELRQVSRADIARHLGLQNVAAPLAEEIAALANGAPGWAMQALAEPGVRQERAKNVQELVDWIGGSTYDRLVQAVRLADRFATDRQKTLDRLGLLLSVWRDMLLTGAGLQHRLTYHHYADQMTSLSASWSLEETHRAIESVQTGIRDLDTNVRPRLAMEAMVQQWPKVSRATAIAR